MDLKFGTPISLAPDGKSGTTVSNILYHITMVEGNFYFTIDRGFYTDGVSLPSCAKYLRTFVPRWAYLKAAIIHDRLWANGKVVNGLGEVRILTQLEIDMEFKAALLNLGASKVRAWSYYLAVRFFMILSGKK